MKSIETIDEYISEFPDNIQKILKKIRSIIKKNAKGSSEAIKYGMPTFVLNGNLVHFAAFKNHIGFYPTPSAVSHFSKELKDYKAAKGSIQFPLEKNIPYGLIERIVIFRVRENIKK